jgi:kinesin family protein 3/17
VYDWNSKQDNVFAESAYPIIDNVLSGYNGTIFAYGQTGTGKTFTISGLPKDPELKGIMPRSFECIFKSIQSDPKKQYLVRASYLEIYNEEIRDLLSKNG